MNIHSMPRPKDAMHPLGSGEQLFDVGATAGFWQLLSGAMRLDSWNVDGPHFVQIALPGDMLGLELLAAYGYRYSATAIVPCTVRSCSFANDADRRNAAIEGLMQGQRRVANLVALRTGTAQERLKQLLLLLAPQEAPLTPQGVHCALPTIKDMAAILDVSPETVSRILSGLKRSHFLDSRTRQSARYSVARLREVSWPPGMPHRGGPQSLETAIIAA